EQTLAKRGEREYVGAGEQLETMARQPGWRGFDTFTGQPLAQVGSRDLDRVGAYRERRALIEGGEQCARLCGTQLGRDPLDQPVGIREQEAGVVAERLIGARKRSRINAEPRQRRRSLGQWRALDVDPIYEVAQEVAVARQQVLERAVTRTQQPSRDR